MKNKTEDEGRSSLYNLFLFVYDKRGKFRLLRRNGTMSTGVVFQQMLVIFLLIGVGVWLFRRKTVTETASRQISGLITNICNPALMIASVFSDQMTATRQQILLTAVVAVGTYACSIAAGILVPLLLRVERQERKYYHMMMVYGNTGFIGIPLISALLGEGAVIYVTVFNFFFNLLIYTHGITVMGTAGGKGVPWKKLINVGTVSSVAALILFWFEIPLPVFLKDSATYMGRCTTFLSMIVLGGSVARMSMRTLFSNKKLYLASAVRLLVIPILAAVILKRLVPDDTIRRVTVLLLAMPVGNMPLMLAQESGEDAEVLAQGAVLSTLLSLFTVTVNTMFL